MNYDLKELIANCEGEDLKNSLIALQDLGYLTERHLMRRYNDETYFVIFNNKNIYRLYITDDECEEIIHFLFYVILNYPDRSNEAAWCLRKCADKKFTMALNNCIELFLARNESSTVTFLIDALSLAYSDPNTIDEGVVKIFLNVYEKGLANSKEVALENIKFFIRNINLYPEKTQEFLKSLQFG